jgi:hypothetical protein
MKIHTLVVAAAAALVATFGFAAPASADPFGLDQPGNNVPGVGGIPDNFNHTYCFRGNGWTAAWHTVVDTQMANLDNQTLYFDTFPIPNGCASTTDVWFELDASLGSTRGDWHCRLWNNGIDGIPESGDDRCEGATIRLNPSVLTDGHQQRKTACHEIGHSVGLAHGTNTATFWNDCMFSGAVPAGLQRERYNAHHVAHANSRTPSTS